MSKESLREYLNGLPPEARAAARQALRIHLYSKDAVAFAEDILGFKPDPFQREMLAAGPGARVAVTCHRQAGKSHAISSVCTHILTFGPIGRQDLQRTTTIIACPSQRQAQEVLRRTRGMLMAAYEAGFDGAKPVTDNAGSIVCASGHRAVALPATEQSIRGLTVDAALLIDEAQHAPEPLVSALLPMTLRWPHSRVYFTGTAWLKGVGTFYHAWAGAPDNGFIGITAKLSESTQVSPETVEQQRALMTADVFRREFECEWLETSESRLFEPSVIERALGLTPQPTPDSTAAVDVDAERVVAVSRPFSFKEYSPDQTMRA